MRTLQRVLDKTCQLLGYDCGDRSAVYLFHFSTEPFQGHQVCLEELMETKNQQGVGC
jgi:hypothetical protein